MTVKEDMVISNVDISGGKLRAIYRVTDIYNVHYWMLPMEQGGRRIPNVFMREG